LAIAAIWAARGQFPLTEILALPYQPAFYHLWYLYALLGIYLLASVVTTRTPASWSFLTALIILMFVLNDAGLTPAKSKLAFDGNSIIYLLFAVSGASFGSILASLSNAHKALCLRASFALFCIFGFAIAVMTHQASIAADTFLKTFYGYTHPLVIGAALSGFTCLHLVSPPKRLTQVIRRISENSLAIYGVHAFILEFVRRAASFVEAPTPLKISAVFISVSFTSYLFARLLRLIDRRKYFT
jgi:surface polysaccharide O-acyltransferase-like enzyme